MKKTLYLSTSIFILLSLTACGTTQTNNNTDSTNVANAAPLQEKPNEEKKEEAKTIDKNFGDNFKESDNGFVAYVNSNSELMLFNKNNENELKLADKVKQYKWHNSQLFYQTTDKVVNEYVSLDQIHMIDTSESNPQSKIIHPFKENPDENYFVSIHDFDISENGKVILVEKHGVLNSEYWFVYKITDTSFQSIKEILPDLDQYEKVINELNWNKEQLVLVVGKEVVFPIYLYEGNEVKEIHPNIGDFINFNAYDILSADLNDDGVLLVETFNNEAQESTNYEIDLKESTLIKK